ncbi:ThiF family adenylyltransferase [Thermodesulfobacteriota bacterium]
MNSGKDSNIGKLLDDHKIQIKDAAGNELDALSEEGASVIGDKCGISIRDVQIGALERGICPTRYIRNREAVSPEEQLKLLKSSAAVVGAGGLGGYIILILARLGLGRLVVIDYDVFDETNLNRQAFCTAETLGKSKSEAAKAALKIVNPGVEVVSYKKKLDEKNGEKILSGCHVAVDALDNVSGRFVLQGLCRKMNMPLVHGAVAGFEGQLMTLFPEDAGLEIIYGNKRNDSNKSTRPEAIMGVPGVTPCLLGTLQSMEVVKILLEKGQTLRNTMAHLDMEACEINKFNLKAGS